MARPVVTVTSGGIAVIDAPSGGIPVTETPVALGGIPVTKVSAALGGIPMTFVDAIGAGGGGAVDVTAEVNALLARMTVQPNAARKQLITDTIASLKGAGVWDLCDCIYLFAAHDAQAALLNWKSASFTCTLPGATPAVFATNHGYTTNTSGGTVNNGYNPQAGGLLWTLSSAHYAVATRTYTNAAGATVEVGSSGNTGICLQNSSGQFQITRAINNSSATQTARALNGADCRGVLMLNRISSSIERAYQAGTQLGADHSAGAIALTSQILLGSVGNSREWSFFSAGASLTAAQITAHNTAILNYLTTVGAYP